MTRERLKELWPVMAHWKNGGDVEWMHDDGSGWMSCPSPIWEGQLEYRIKPVPRLVPLEAEDWLTGGPWWVRRLEDESTNLSHPALVAEVMESSIRSGSGSFISFGALRGPQYQRRSGSDPDGKWMPCSKEAKE